MNARPHSYPVMPPPHFSTFRHAREAMHGEAVREALAPAPTQPVFSSHLSESLFAIGADAMRRAGATLGEGRP